jgi:hypothetical protein
MGLSPFEILKADLEEVFELYVKCVTHDFKEKKNKNDEEVQWVTSKNATWR